jgi:phosphoribosylformylglycinamidine cyclo-ligase
VGTKLQVAQMLDRHDTVGIDLVAMCVNDVICCGAEPLFFLDYVAMSHDDPARLEQIVSGVSEGCRQSGSALLGGETAIMPGTYRRGDYDLAGFQVGVVERKQLVNGSAIAAGDIVIGLASTGVHSNGFSLVRKIVFDVAGIDAKQHVDELGATVGETLLTPTRIYVDATQSVLGDKALRSAVHGIAQWKIPPVFPWLKGLGNVDVSEMYRVFNMGIGMVLIVNPSKAVRISRVLDNAGYKHSVIGEAVPGKGKVKINKRRTR